MDGELRLSGAGAGALDPPVALTRRRLLALGAGAVAAAGVGTGLARLTDVGSVPFGLRRSDWTAHVGQSFTLRTADGHAMSTRLSAVSDFPGQRGVALAGSEDAFILLFHAPPGSPRLGSAVMHIAGPGGSFGKLLLSPAGTGRRGLDYAGVINRAVPKRGVPRG